MIRLRKGDLRRLRILKILLCSGLAVGPAGYTSSAQADVPGNKLEVSRCASLMQLKIAGLEIERAENLSDQSQFINADGYITKTNRPICRVVASMNANSGGITFEIWLPVDWNGRLLGIGKNGFGGYINYRELASGVSRGFAAVSGDTGFKGAGPAVPGQRVVWATDQRALWDWAHSSVHSMTVTAKQIIREFYRRDIQFSYFSGCGGVEAMREVQDFPDDYDGVDVRSPGLHYGGLMQSFLWGAMLPARLPDALLTRDALTLLNQAALKTCGGTDALKNGYLDHPTQCHFDPSHLICKSGGGNKNCLNTMQVEQAKRLYSPILNTLTGEVIYPGFAPGSENSWGAIQGDLATFYAQPLLGTAVFGDAHWNWTNFDFGASAALIDQRLSANVDATNPDISRFRRRGGKLIMTQGWADSTNAPTTPIEYFNSVAAHEGGVENAQRSFLLLMVPGMGHCGSGPGPTTLGGSSPPTQYTPDRDVLSALQAWVERKKKPKSFISTKYIDDDSKKGVKFERTICVYPKVSRYDGSGNRSLASSYRCVE